MGYAYSPRFRLSYDSGPDVIYDLTTMTDAKGPVSIKVQYEQEKTSRQTPNRRTIERHFGWRPVCAMIFDLATMTDEAWIADVASAANRDDADLYLSLDGGVTERQVTLESNYSRFPLGDKAPAGV